MKLLYGLVPMLLAPIGISLMSNDQLTLTSKSNPSTNNIRLDWTMNDLNNKTFKVYQKKPGSSEFQSISTTNFESTEKVRVLNLYPVNSSMITTTFTTWKGETYTLPESASLHKWMEEPNSENAKGYGKGIIDVDSISLNDFQANIKNYNVSDYDVIFIGAYDGNGSVAFNDDILNFLVDWVNSGKGLLMGHDTLNSAKYEKLYSLIKIKRYEDVGFVSSTNAIGSKVIKVTKKGLLTNYPYVINQEKLNIPLSHSWQSFAYGDIWMQYTDLDTGQPYWYKENISDPTGQGTNNYYLTTWNNVAMIQTGHIMGYGNAGDNPIRATADEQKVLANTLFYLNQLSSDNFLNDNSGQDLSEPNKPLITGHNFISGGNIEVTFNQATDNGSAYEYYVQAEDKNGTIYKSNTVKETITSGIKGYSYVVDNNPSTIPDNTIEQTTNTPIKISTSTNEVYVHIKAIDNAGNESETYHYKISDTSKPIVNIVGNPTEWTNSDVKLNINAEDIDSGIDYILLPNGNKVSSSSTSYVVSSNGNYTFKVVDKMGNETTQTISVNKIDKVSPTITTNKVVNSNKTSATINVTVNDTLSGVQYIELPNGTKITNSTSYTFTTSENGIFPFTVVDNAGNKTTVTVEVFELNENNSSSNISRIEYKLSGATVQGWTTYTAPFYVSNEGITTVTARSYDNAGNISSEQISTVKIDKTKPNNNSILIQLK